MSDDVIRSYVETHRGEHLEVLKSFVRYESISAQSDHLDDCGACAEWLVDRFAKLGLDAVIEPLGRPAVVAAGPPRSDRPALLVYGHYDVQPPDPVDLWRTDPFTPTVVDGDLVARGVSDDKGPLLTWLLAAEAYRATVGEPPVNLKFLVEGEEEIGSPSLEAFIAGEADRLACDYVAISDTGFYDADTPAVTYGLRGLTYLEATLTGPARDLHSGLYGGIVVNPLNALARLIAGLHDPTGRVAIEGFYDDVVEPTDQERRMWASLTFDERALMEEMGVDHLGGDADVGGLDRLWALPSLDCHGIWGGYMDEGPKTVIPAWAKAKLSVRLAPGQHPDRVNGLLRDYFQSRCPAGARVRLEVLCQEDPWLIRPDSPALAAAQAAMTDAFEQPCALIRCGASVPVTIQFHKHLGVDPLMMGYALPDDRVHSPNEKFSIDHFHRGIVASAALMRRLAAQ